MSLTKKNPTNAINVSHNNNAPSLFENDAAIL
jgi:hypothetical protein